MKDHRESLRPYIADMAAVEKHILEAVERQHKDDDLRKFPEAFQIVDRLTATLRRHVETLETHIEGFPGGSVAASVKESVTGALGALAGVYDKIRKDTASRMLRDDYTALGLAIISYTMLHTTALGLRQNSTAEIAQRHLKELTPFQIDISGAIPSVVARELADQGYPIEPNLAHQATEATREAWSRSNVGTVNVGEPVGSFTR
jgi:ferritin-like metal-binding protein YciE